MNKIQLYSQILKNMGWDYVSFRSVYELQRKTGWLKRKFPTIPEKKVFCTLSEWRKSAPPFFFSSKEQLAFPKNKEASLQKEFDHYQNGQLRYFNAELLQIGKEYDWITNPSTSYQYDISKHWTEVKDLSSDAGDIKFTWEKSRFSFLYTLIRYDYHFEEDCAEIVFREIDSWMAANPINQGPNYKCSQEISLRILNWIFALYYYRDAPELTEERFEKILHYIYWQLKHVYFNINFSLKTVRNNHAITEVLMLYLGGTLFPFFPEVAKWKSKGKKWFEQEIAYQIYPDGTFLQFSHNYHRVLLQLLTWAFRLSELHGERFSDVVYSRAKNTLQYLLQCTDPENGQLPNYGANDGALFFKFNNQPYRDYRPQLNALYYFFNQKYFYKETELEEDCHWLFSQAEKQQQNDFSFKNQHILNFPKGGYYTIREKDYFTFIRCGSYKDRPSHADNLHIDLWYKGENIVRDAGTYKYNTDQDLVKYFNGTKAHNTLTLGDHDQMLKGPRFIWLYWTQAVEASLKEEEEVYRFSGKINAFKQIAPDIYHSRTVIKHKDKAYWEIEDTLSHNTDLALQQHWNIAPSFEAEFTIKAESEDGQVINPTYKEGWYSGLYGIKEKTKTIAFISQTKKIRTIIQKK